MTAKWMAGTGVIVALGAGVKVGLGEKTGEVGDWVSTTITVGGNTVAVGWLGAAVAADTTGVGPCEPTQPDRISVPASNAIAICLCISIPGSQAVHASIQIDQVQLPGSIFAERADIVICIEEQFFLPVTAWG